MGLMDTAQSAAKAGLRTKPTEEDEESGDVWVGADRVEQRRIAYGCGLAQRNFELLVSALSAYNQLPCARQEVIQLPQ